MNQPPSLGSVAAGIAHDVRGPIGVIVAVLHEIEQSAGAAVGADLERLLEMARRSTRKLERTAATLDAVAQLEQPQLSTVDLCHMLHAAVDRMRSLERRSELKLTLPSATGTTRVQVAPALFPHALEELVGWALRRNPAELRLEIQRPDESANVVVVVTVVGVAVLPASARPFQDPLGLARQLLEAQGAGLSIEAVEGNVVMAVSVPAAPQVVR